ncbi:MAG: hypothetical protein CMJ41_07230 [Phycisphaerae bacterium]|nr:hypothetical protein [Phycisphaerae bacterium]HBZ97770.1 hypothetical protein [Phycisphaerales bacterium]
MHEIKRLIVMTVLLAAAVGGGIWWGFNDRQEAKIRDLEARNVDLADQLEKRSEMLQRLGRERRLGLVRVLEQPEVGGVVESTTFELIELDDDGSELARQSFSVPGDVVFIDAQTVRFRSDDVASGHPFRGRTLVLLRRVYSDRMPPVEGLPIDLPGAVPPGYASETVGRFERGIWEQFWGLARDPEAAESIGIRVAQGEAAYKPMQAGDVFELRVDALGGISLVPVQPPSDWSGDLHEIVSVSDR